jgi:hypothetical protein
VPRILLVKTVRSFRSTGGVRCGAAALSGLLVTRRRQRCRRSPRSIQTFGAARLPTIPLSFEGVVVVDDRLDELDRAGFLSAEVATSIGGCTRGDTVVGSGRCGRSGERCVHRSLWRCRIR